MFMNYMKLEISLMKTRLKWRKQYCGRLALILFSDESVPPCEFINCLYKPWHLNTYDIIPTCIVKPWVFKYLIDILGKNLKCLTVFIQSNQYHCEIKRNTKLLSTLLSRFDLTAKAQELRPLSIVLLAYRVTSFADFYAKNKFNQYVLVIDAFQWTHHINLFHENLFFVQKRSK